MAALRINEQMELAEQEGRELYDTPTIEVGEKHSKPPIPLRPHNPGVNARIPTVKGIVAHPVKAREFFRGGSWDTPTMIIDVRPHDSIP